jgi:hypothetical protein
MNGPATARTDEAHESSPRPRKRLRREAAGLVFVYGLFAVVSGALAFQCVERPEARDPAVGTPADDR